MADPEGGPGGDHAPQTMRMQHAKISDHAVNTKYSMQTLSTTVCFTLHIRLGTYKKFKIRLIYRSSDFALKCMRKISPLDLSSQNLHLMGERLELPMENMPIKGHMKKKANHEFMEVNVIFHKRTRDCFTF